MRVLTLTVSVIIAFALFLGGCGRTPVAQQTDDKRVVAKINNYELTVSDFKNEAGVSFFSDNPMKVKKELLDNLITKKILVQEAQRGNFDKEKAFMEEIERYWEQALLKLLIKKKTEEFYGNITVDEKEARDEYARLIKEGGGQVKPYEKMSAEINEDIRHRKIQAALDNWMMELRKKSDINVNEEVLKEIDVK